MTSNPRPCAGVRFRSPGSPLLLLMVGTACGMGEVLRGGVHWSDAALDPEGAAGAALASHHWLFRLDLAMPFGGR